MASTSSPTQRPLQGGEIRIRVVDYELGQPAEGSGAPFGREILGEIVEIGPGVSGPVLGQRVAAWVPMQEGEWGPPPPVMVAPVEACVPVNG